MISSEILCYVNGVRLSMDGKQDFSKYNFKARAPARVSVKWMESIIETRDDAILFGAFCAWNGLYHHNLSPTNTIEFDDWKDRLTRPSIALKELEIDSVEAFKDFCNDGAVGSKALNELSGKRLHPISFCFLDASTGITKTWSSYNWKMMSTKVSVMQKCIRLDQAYISQFAKHLKESMYK